MSKPAVPVKHPGRTKRYTPPKVLQPPPTPVVNEAPDEEVSLPIQPYPTQARLAPWGDHGVVLMLSNPISAGTFHLTWGQFQQMVRTVDGYAAQLIERRGDGANPLG